MENKGKGIPFILFNLDKTTYAIESAWVLQMEMIGQITPVPNSPPFIEGVTFLRGMVIPVINLRVRFGKERKPFDLSARLMVLEKDGKRFGLVVDSSREFLEISPESIQPPPETLTELAGRYLKGIILLEERPVIILDPEELIKMIDLGTNENEIEERRE